MLSPQSWLPQAEQLDVGKRARVDHDCGAGRTLLISRNADGYRAYCFRCGDSGSAKPPQPSLAELAESIRRLQAGDALLHQGGTGRRLELPAPQVHVVSEWPEQHRLWLYRAGIGKAEIGQLGAYYHPPSARVVLPVMHDGKPVFWQARAVDNRTPKYMAPDVDRASVLPRYGSATSPTLTEDILSAFKVGLVGEGWALMGTKLSMYAMNELRARGCTVNVWMDNDLPPRFPVNRGQIAARKIIKQLTAFGIPCRNIISTKDPKLHTREEIGCLLTSPH